MMAKNDLNLVGDIHGKV